MSYFYEAEQIKNRIENHLHYFSCFYSSDEYFSFDSNRHNLNRIKNCFDGLDTTENKIINQNNIKNNKERELDNLIQTTNEKFENEKKRLDNEEEIHRRENERNLEQIKNEYESNQLKKNNELKNIQQDILNLKEEITKLNEKFNLELDLKKKEVINKISNNYQIKLLQYENEKKLEKQKIEKEAIIEKTQFEANKEIEFNELKNKAELTQKIIMMFKKLSLNS